MLYYARFGDLGADALRAEAVVSSLAVQRAADVAARLRRMAQSVHEPKEFRETTAQMGALLGFQAVAVGPNVEWHLDFEGPEAGAPGKLRWTLSEPHDLIVPELASAANKLSTLLDELGWRTLLPKGVVALAIERGFSRHGLSTADLFRRLTPTHVA